MTIAAITENHPEKDLAALFPGAEVEWMTTVPAQAGPAIAAYVDLDFIAEPTRIEKLSGLLPALVFVNAVTPTLQEIGRPFVRINAWPGFATRKVHELVIPGITPTAPEATTGTASGFAANPGTAATAASIAPTLKAAPTPDTAPMPSAAPTPGANMADRVIALYRQLDCRYLAAPDVPGMISARVVAGIINEAWYTWEEKVSTKEEIDTAMRLGTNYPLGPFEWGERIGLAKIVGLLLALSETDPRYTPARTLLAAASAAHETGSKSAENVSGRPGRTR
ncbi:MAG TPA: 3-hydroxyacyl-CoA dehydrogenase family protein [Puia sp.]|nr:3-hydroxyacyl-CoA dehydrogenase family protein [Puia sp.]